MPKFQCVQFGVCPKADSSECFEVNSEFLCGRSPEDPDCQSKLEEVAEKKRLPVPLIAGVTLGVLAIGAIIAFALSGDDAGSTRPEKATVEELLKEVWPWLD